MVSVENSVRKFIVDLSRPSKQFTMVFIDIVAYLGCTILSGYLIFGSSFDLSAGYLLALITVSMAVPLGWITGLYGTVVRFIGIEFLIRANITAFISATAISLIAYVSNFPSSPYRLAIILWALMLLYICASRFTSRHLLSPRRNSESAERVVIYGAGSAGAQLAGGLQMSRTATPVAMLDDDPSLRGKRVQGLKVYGPAELPKLITTKHIDSVLLALPQISRRRRREIIENIEQYPVRVQTIPDFNDLVNGVARVDDIRDVSIADLMGRPPVPPDPELLHASIKDKTVMVTGAGGSIGSELCRQILTLGVSRLVLIENSEAALYNIDRELRKTAEQSELDLEIIALLASVCEYRRISDVLETYRVQTIYHAAAYKHVPIVEQNLLEGIHNNAIGTMQLATAACDAGVEAFVLVSTDKAVRPSNMMGATKRVAELVLQAMQEQFPETRLCMVRFGNVLDSSGSVVPLFREQIRHGGPVTVTHRDIVRYFMTIPEAAELVIQAGAMARGGDVFVLDMGEPIRIQDLARRMIKLMGMTICDEANPDGDIEIQYTGLRPAEKLYEELVVGDDVSGTEHPRIMRAVEDYLPFDTLIEYLRELSATVQAQDCERARELLVEVAVSYKPTSDINDLVWNEKQKSAAHSKQTVSNVTKLAAS